MLPPGPCKVGADELRLHACADAHSCAFAPADPAPIPQNFTSSCSPASALTVPYTPQAPGPHLLQQPGQRAAVGGQTALQLAQALIQRQALAAQRVHHGAQLARLRAPRVVPVARALQPVLQRADLLLHLRSSAPQY